MRQIGKALAAVTLMGLCACSHATIANTPIPDNELNRQLLTVLGKFKNAVEAKDTDAVMALVSPEYLDVAIPGKTKESKDYTQLKAALLAEFEHTRTIRLEVHPREVTVRGDEANIDYFYVVRYDPVLPTVSQWRSETDDARLKLSRLNGQWKIISGL